MTEDEERFLREVATRIPLARVEEIHLFAPLAQNGAVSGVAVVAVAEEQKAEGDGETTADAQEALRARFAVYTARYRHVQKGPERGKWEFDMSVEADAPLLSIDRVVSGVIQRSGEQGEPVRLTAAQVRAAIGDVNCTATK